MTSGELAGPGPEESAAAPDRRIRVLVVDDHRLFRDGVASLLQRAPEVLLVGEAATGEEAVRLAREVAPDVVLMDLQMPGAGGVAATREIVGERPEVGVVALTMFEDDESVFAALRAGARGYVLKDADRGALLRAIRAVAQGEVLFGPPVADRVLRHFARPIAARPAQGPGDAGAPPAPVRVAGPYEALTRRETEILRLIADGLRNREVAARLTITEKTVENHISSIFAKLQVEDRAQAVIHAFRSGLVRAPPGDGSPA